MDIVGLLIQLASGAIGGNVAGKVMPKLSLGTLGNSIAGIAGGGLGGQLLTMALGSGAAGGGMDLMGIVGSLASGGVGGGIVMAVIGAIKKMISK